MILLARLLPLLLGLLPVLQDPADEQYQFLAGLYDKGLHELVVREGTSFLEKHPRHGRADLARYRVAGSLYELGRLEEAAAHYRLLAAREGFEFRPESALRLGQCALSLGRLEEAASAFEQVRSEEAAYLHLPAAFLLAETRFRQERFSEAAPLYEEVLAAEDNETWARDALYGLTWCRFRLGEEEECLRLAARFEERHAGDPLVQEIRFLRGEALLELDRPEEARAAYLSVQGGPFADAALRGAAFATSRLARPAEAAALFGRLAAEFPESGFRAEARLQQGIHLLQAGEARAAVEVLNRPETGATPEVLYWRGRAWLAAGEAGTALQTLEAAWEEARDPGLRARLATARGDALFQLGRLEEAALAYDAAGSDYALQAAAVASLNAGRPEEAERVARRLLETHPDSPYREVALLALGEALLARERPAEARTAFEEVAATTGDPGRRSRARSRIAWCRYLAGETEVAARAFAELLQEQPEAAEAEEAAWMAGRAWLDAGRTEEARSAWRAYLAAWPEGPHRPRVLLALGRLEGGEAGRALLVELARKWGGDPLAPEALFEAADAACKAGAHAEARRLWQQLLERYPASERVEDSLYGLAWCHFETGESGPALVWLDRLEPRLVPEEGPSPRPELLLSVRELRVWSEKALGHPDRARAAFESFAALCRDPERLGAAARVTASALQEAGRGEEAVLLLAGVRDRLTDPDAAAAALLEEAWALLELGRGGEGEARLAAIRRLTGARPENAELAFFLGEARFEAGEDEAARALYRQALEPDPNPVRSRALYKLGFAALRQDDLEAAAAAFAEIVERYPEDELWGESLFLEGEARFRMGDHAGAAERFSRLREAVPEHEVLPKALFREGLARAQLGQWEEAERLLSELLRREPEFPNRAEAELWRGRALAALGNPRAARAAFEAVLARDQGVLSARARLGLGLLHWEAGEMDAALSEFLKVAVLYGHDEEVAEGLYRAGLCLERLGDPDRARARYEEILERFPGTAHAGPARERLDALGG